MGQLDKSTAYPRSVFMVDSSDHVTGKTGLTLTITTSKAGAAFASITPTVTELGNGWYSLALTTSHTDTLGDLAFHITASGADALDFADQVTDPDALLKRDFSAVTGEAARSMLNALRFLRNKWFIASGTLTVTKEDDSTSAWTGAVTTTAGNPTTGVDPA